jgi:protein involved in polysaccharide export with SLBB domain
VPLTQWGVTETTLGPTTVFGQWLFQGKFAQTSVPAFNPDYLISIGDTIDLRLWGAYQFGSRLTVDAQGNIFVPQVGPISVLNVRNGDLNDVVRNRVKQVYRSDVGVYATLAAAQPVKVFVGGNVKRPGLYFAFASDSLLHYLDAAGGIDPKSGSFHDIRVIRNGTVVRTIDLYDFMVDGKMTLVQFRDGDTIFVGPLRSTVLVSGLVATPTQFEISEPLPLSQLMKMAGVSERATNVRVTHNTGAKREVVYLSLKDSADTQIQGGDEIEVMADRLLGNIIVGVDGEHEGRGQYVLPYKATLKDLLEVIQFSDRSQKDSLQLFRQSIAARQKQVLDQMLQKLEQSVLTARSATAEEAQLRTQEANLVLQFIERARKIDPRGQLILPKEIDPASIALEDGDLIRIPRQSNVVTVHGEIYIPNAFIWEKGLEVEDYIKKSGGLNQNTDGSRILLMHLNGEIATTSWQPFMDFTHVRPGDEVLVLPQIDDKKFQLTKDIVEVMYQIAIAAGVLVRL